jgi:hypothetical protein
MKSQRWFLVSGLALVLASCSPKSPSAPQGQTEPVTEDIGQLGSTSGGRADATFAINSPYWRSGDRAIVCVLGQTPGKPLRPAVVLLLKLPSQNMPSFSSAGQDGERSYWHAQFSTAGKQQYAIKYEIAHKPVADKLVLGEQTYSLEAEPIFLVDLAAEPMQVTRVKGEVKNLVAEGKTGREELKRAVEKLRTEHKSVHAFWPESR